MALCFLFALWCWFVWFNTGEWTTNPHYNYGWIVPVLALFFLHRNLRGAEESPPPGRHFRWIGSLFVLACVAVIGLELIRLSPATTRIAHWSAWMAVTAITCLAVWSRFGFSGIRSIAFPCLFMATGVPWPSFVEQFLLNELSYVIAQAVGASFMILGIYCQVSGNLLVFADGTVGIEEACSGLRLFQASVMCSLGLGEFFYLRWRHRIALIALGSLIALILNAIRSYSLCWIFLAGGSDAVPRWHDTVGALTVAVLTLSLLLFAQRWDRLPRQRPSKSALESIQALLRLGIFQRWSLSHYERYSMALIVLGFLFSQLWFWQGSKQNFVRPAFLTADMVDRDRFRVESLNDYEIELLNPDESFRVTARRDDQVIWGAYYIYQRASRNPMKFFYHRPEICLPGVGWEKVAEKPVITETFRGRSVAFIPMQFRHSQGESIWIYWAAWFNGEPFGYGEQRYGLTINRHVLDYISRGIRTPSTEVFAFYTRQSAQGEIHDVDDLLDRLFIEQ